MRINTPKTSIVSIKLLAALMPIVLILSGCQKEIIEIAQSPADKVITPHSIVANLTERIALKDGSYDNILDKSSCISLKLPIAVVVNGQSLLIHSGDQFHLVEDIFEESSSDHDTLSIIFPVTIIKADYTEQLIQSQSELDAITSKCVEGGGDSDIECVDFKYPLSYSKYDSSNQVSDVITIKDDKELYLFFNSLDSSDLVSLRYPVTLLLSGGQEVNVNNNIDLQASIEGHQKDCNENDNNNYNNDDLDDTPFIDVLTNGTWKITKLLKGTSDQTSAFTGFSFTFNTDGTALSTDGNSSTEGSWNSYGDSGYLGVELDFGQQPHFDTIHGDWKITGFGSQVIKLEQMDYEDGLLETLVFEKI